MANIYNMATSLYSRSHQVKGRPAEVRPFKHWWSRENRWTSEQIAAAVDELVRERRATGVSTTPASSRARQEVPRRDPSIPGSASFVRSRLLQLIAPDNHCCLR